MAESWPVVPAAKEEERTIWRAKSWVKGGAEAATAAETAAATAIVHEINDEPEEEWPEVPHPALDERKFWQSASWRKPHDDEVEQAWKDLKESIETLQKAGHEVPALILAVVETRQVLPQQEEELRATYLGFKEHMQNPEGIPEELVSAATSFLKGYDVLKNVYMPLNISAQESMSDSDDSLGVDELEEMAEILEG